MQRKKSSLEYGAQRKVFAFRKSKMRKMSSLESCSGNAIAFRKSKMRKMSSHGVLNKIVMPEMHRKLGEMHPNGWKTILVLGTHAKANPPSKNVNTTKMCQRNSCNRQKAQTLIGLLCCWSLPFCSMSWSTASATVFFCRRSLGGCGPGGAASAAIENLFHGSCANAPESD